MPGYTHLQIAMPSSFGLWFGAYAETLVDDMRLIAAAWHIANQNPLGSAAGYGSSFPLDREMTTRLLGFEALHYNVVAAQMSRGKSERTAANAIAAVAATIGRLAMDICLFMSQNFGFVSLPDNLTTGSSIMPHKKNPDVFEIMRGRCNRLQSVPNEIALLTANLPVGYHRDMQLLKDILFPATTEIKRTLSMCDFMLAHLKVNTDILDERKYDYLSRSRTSTASYSQASRSAKPTSRWAWPYSAVSTIRRARCTTPTKAASATSAPPKSAGRWSA